jgi:prepilin-type N-terminal cleavage/methylation domain-containing protein
MTQRRGFTLIEVLLALVIMGMVTGAIYQLLNTNQRLSLAQAEQVNLQSNVRTGSLVVPNELRELKTVLGSGDPTQNDVTVADANGITYRAMRGLGFLCQNAGANEVRIDASTWSGTRTPEATRDGLYVFWDQDPDDEDDDSWVQLAITGVANSTCGAVPAVSLTVPGVPAVPAGTPVRVFELMRLDIDQDASGEYWLWAESINGGGGPQRLLGPLTNNGFQLQYLNSAGNVTAALDAITSIRITVRGLTDDAVRAAGTGTLAHAQEALATQVLLRNSIRP